MTWEFPAKAPSRDAMATHGPFVALVRLFTSIHCFSQPLPLGVSCFHPAIRSILRRVNLLKGAKTAIALDCFG
jgi:hypothetical protein